MPIHVGEIGYSTADDASILEKCREEDRIAVTLDADFHTLLALSGATSPSVIRIRMEGMRGEETASLIQSVITDCGEDLERGAVVTVRQRRVRIRNLPLLS